jgi:DNA-binding CsgD family transcriptional regulator
MRYATVEQHHAIYAAIADSGSGRMIANTLFQTAAAFDFTAATLFVMPSKTDRELASLVLESSLPPEFWEQMDKVYPLPSDALFNAARGSIVPVQWSADRLRRQSELVNEAEPPVLALYADYSISHGIVFPVSSIDGARYAMRFDGNRPPLAQAEINDLAMLAMHFFQAYDRGRYPLGNDPCGLSERDLDVVRWSATGQTSSEIATVMSLSDHTINAYMNNALKKLNCANRTQLVARALRMRIIS